MPSQFLSFSKANAYAMSKGTDLRKVVPSHVEEIKVADVSFKVVSFRLKNGEVIKYHGNISTKQRALQVL